MLSNIGTLLAISALTSLSAGSLAQTPAPGDSITVPICGEHATISIPLGHSPLDPRRDCQGACHAACHRETFAVDDEE